MKSITAMIVLTIAALVMISCADKERQEPGTEKSDPGAGIYDLPYVLPDSGGIHETIARVRDYFYSRPDFRIIDTKTKKEITDFSVLNENADYDREGTSDVISIWGYTMGVTYMSMLKAYEITGDKKFLDYPLRSMKNYFDHLAYFEKIDSAFGQKDNTYRAVLHTRSLDDCGAMGAAIIKIYKRTKDERMLPVINKIADYISNKQFRLADGTLARQRPQPRSIWGDDAYMSIPFLAQMYSLSGEQKYIEDAVKQYLQMSNYLFKWDTKIYDHGKNMDNDYDPAFYWSRANGWMIMAACELLDVLPENHSSRDSILKILRTHIQGLAEHQGGNGFWHNILDRYDSYEETSGTAMFVYGIAHAVNKGWVNQTFGSVAQAGWNALTTIVKSNGQVDGTCWGTTFANDEVYYYHRPANVNAAHGYGPVIFAGAEMIDLLNNDKIVVQEQWRTFHYRLKSELKDIRQH